MNHRTSTAPRALLAALLAFAAVPRVQAAEPAGQITLERALALAAEHNPALQTARHGEAIAEALVEQAGYRPNPTLDVSVENFAGTGAYQEVRGLEGTVQASQTLERGGKRGKRVAVATRQREIALHEFAIQRRKILAETAAAFVDAVASRDRVVLARDPRQLARQNRAAVQARIDAGMGSPAELARARAAVAAADAEFARSEAAFANAAAALAAHWGSPDDMPEIAPTGFALPPSLPDRDALQARLAGSPELELETARIAGSRAELELQRAHATEDVTVGAGLRWLRADDDAALVASVSVPLPIHHRNQGNIRAARESLAQSEQAARSAATDLRMKFSAAWRDLAAAHRAAARLRTDALPATESAAIAVREAYDQGHLPLIDVLDAQRALAVLRREILDADFSYAAALVRVEALTDPTFPLTRELLSHSQP